jgi:putative CocE/NonD family hydrolase
LGEERRLPKVITQFPRKVRIVENVFIPMSDGIQLAAKLWLPEDADCDPVPAILEYVPYRKRDGTRTYDQGSHMYWAGHGYACLRLDIRGSGDSEGLIDDEYTPQEQKDGVEAIAWIAAQPWCSGNVGMIGISWGGFNGLQIAALQPPALKTIITVGSTDDRYATDIHWVGGCLSKDNFDWSATMMAHNDLPPDPAIVGEKWRAMWEARMRHNRPWILTWLQHQRRDDFWKQGSVCEDFSKIRIPVYAVNGWADNYSESIPRLLAGLTAPSKGLIGPWAHSYPHDATVTPEIGWLQEALRWWDQWLKGKPTGIMDEPRYRVWMQDSVRPQTCYHERLGRWVAEAEWPSARIRWKKLHLNPGGVLEERTRRATPMTICSPLWVGAAAGEIGRYGDQAEWATDQREDDGGSLVFITEPLEAKTEILGAPQLDLVFASDKPLALVAVRLNDVAPDGSSTRVTVGLLNLNHMKSHEKPVRLKPGTSYTATVDLDDIAHAFPKGHRIAVSLSTVYWPIAWPSPELVTLTVFGGKTALRLPVRPEDPKDDRLPPFGEPEQAEDTPYVKREVPAKTRRTVTRDLLSGRITVDFPRWTGETEMTDIGQTFTSEARCRYTIVEGDPLSATVETDYRVSLKRPDTKVTHHSVGRMTCDATHFRIAITLDVYENDAKVFTKSWDERIKRDFM